MLDGDFGAAAPAQERSPFPKFPWLGRRELLLGVGATALAGCGSGSTTGVPPTEVSAAPPPVPTPSPVATVNALEPVDPQRFYKPEHGDNWQPALQAAFQAASGRRAEVVLARMTYNCRQLDQTGALPDVHADNARPLFFVAGSIAMRSIVPGGSTIVRLAPNGSAMGPNDYFEASGYKWRGGLFLIRSTSTEPNLDPALYSFTAHDVLFDGGLRYHPAQPYEIGDKGLWQANDRNNGHITLTGLSGFIGVASECLYTSAINGAEASRRLLTIGPDCRFGESFLSALNPQGITLAVERCTLENAFIGIEGWTGGHGGYFKGLLRNCRQSSIQGGTYNTDPQRGGYYAYTSPTSGDALGFLDVVLDRAAGFAMGSGLRGAVRATDCCPTIGDSSVFNNGVRNTDVSVTSVVDTVSLNPGLFVLGGSQGSLATDDVHVNLMLERTPGASANGNRHLNGLGYYGSFGRGVTARVSGMYPSAGQAHAPFASVYDNTPLILVG